MLDREESTEFFDPDDLGYRGISWIKGKTDLDKADPGLRLQCLKKALRQERNKLSESDFETCFYKLILIFNNMPDLEEMSSEKKVLLENYIDIIHLIGVCKGQCKGKNVINRMQQEVGIGCAESPLGDKYIRKVVLILTDEKINSFLFSKLVNAWAKFDVTYNFLKTSHGASDKIYSQYTLPLTDKSTFYIINSFRKMEIPVSLLALFYQGELGHALEGCVNSFSLSQVVMIFWYLHKISVVYYQCRFALADFSIIDQQQLKGLLSKKSEKQLEPLNQATQCDIDLTLIPFTHEQLESLSGLLINTEKIRKKLKYQRESPLSNRDVPQLIVIHTIDLFQQLFQDKSGSIDKDVFDHMCYIVRCLSNVKIEQNDLEDFGNSLVEALERNMDQNIEPLNIKILGVIVRQLNQKRKEKKLPQFSFSPEFTEFAINLVREALKNKDYKNTIDCIWLLTTTPRWDQVEESIKLALPEAIKARFGVENSSISYDILYSLLEAFSFLSVKWADCAHELRVELGNVFYNTHFQTQCSIRVYDFLCISAVVEIDWKVLGDTLGQLLMKEVTENLKQFICTMSQDHATFFKHQINQPCSLLMKLAEIGRSWRGIINDSNLEGPKLLDTIITCLKLQGTFNDESVKFNSIINLTHTLASLGLVWTDFNDDQHEIIKKAIKSIPCFFPNTQRNRLIWSLLAFNVESKEGVQLIEDLLSGFDVQRANNPKLMSLAFQAKLLTGCKLPWEMSKRLETMPEPQDNPSLLEKKVASKIEKIYPKIQRNICIKNINRIVDMKFKEIYVLRTLIVSSTCWWRLEANWSLWKWMGPHILMI